MIDFNDEKITEEQKQDTLLQQIDPVYKEKRIQYGVQPFKASWIINYRMLEVLNNNAHTNEGIFDFYKKDIAKYDPSMTVALFEGETIREGEWDRFYNCWSKRDYIRCMVMFPNGILTNITEKHGETWIIELDADNEEVFKNKICKYPNSWNIDGSLNEETTGTGIIEFDLSMLDWLDKEIISKRKHKAEDDDTEYEDIEELCNDGLFRKIERKYWELKAHFDKTVREKIEGKDEKKKVKDNRRSNARKRKNKRGIKRSFNQGFSV